MTIQTAYSKLFDKYLYHSYLYYIRNDSEISDDEYDSVCMTLNAAWKMFTHNYKDLTNQTMLGQTTGYHIKEEWYPQYIRDSFK